MKIISHQESAYIRRFTKHSEEVSVSQDRQVEGVVILAIGKELVVASSFAEDNSEASLSYFPSQGLTFVTVSLVFISGRSPYCSLYS